MLDCAVTLAHFEPLVGSQFLLRLDDEGTLPAQLIEARAVRQGSSDVRPPFSLTFEGPAEPMLPQRTYRVEHPALDAMDIFLVPVARTTTGLHYQAVFG